MRIFILLALFATGFTCLALGATRSALDARGYVGLLGQSILTVRGQRTARSTPHAEQDGLASRNTRPQLAVRFGRAARAMRDD